MFLCFPHLLGCTNFCQVLWVPLIPLIILLTSRCESLPLIALTRALPFCIPLFFTPCLYTLYTSFLYPFFDTLTWNPYLKPFLDTLSLDLYTPSLPLLPPLYPPLTPDLLHLHKLQLQQLDWSDLPVSDADVKSPSWPGPSDPGRLAWRGTKKAEDAQAHFQVLFGASDILREFAEIVS